MYSFNQPITPAAKSHMNAQLSFFNDMSKTLFRSAQKISELNINLVQTLMEESTHVGQEILTAKMPAEVLSMAATQAHPLTEKMRAYQQYLTRIAADSQVDLSQCAGEHVQETSRTAKALADEVVKMTTEEIESVKQRQMDAVRKATEQINEWQGGDGHASIFSSGNSDSPESTYASPSQAAGQSESKQDKSPRKNA